MQVWLYHCRYSIYYISFLGAVEGVHVHVHATCHGSASVVIIIAAIQLSLGLLAC